MSNIGPTGSKGAQGPQGTQGLQGSQGTHGAQGTQGSQGSQGSQGRQGIAGPQGQYGAQGTRGYTGAQGVQGRQGLQGTQGTQGTRGVAGFRGAQGPEGAQGSTGQQGQIGYTGAQGEKGSAFTFDGPTGSILYYDGHDVMGVTGFVYTPGGSGMNVEGNITPAVTNRYTLGTTGSAWRTLHIGPGTIGADEHGIVYAESGFATPFINVGPTMNSLDPVAIGGWVIGPTGIYGNRDYDLITQQKSLGAALPDGLTGPVYSLTRPLGNVVNTSDLNGITTKDPAANLTFGSVGDTGIAVSYRPIILRDANENVVVQITTDSDGNGSITFGGGTNSISMNNGLSISNITHQTDNPDIQPLSYNTNGSVTYGQLNYAHFQGFPRLPAFSSDADANAAMSPDPFHNVPQEGQMYFNRTNKKTMIYDGTQWIQM